MAACVASLLVNVAPLLVALVAGVWLKEGIGRRLLAGCVLSFAGVGLIALGTSNRGVSSQWGAWLCIIAAAAYADLIRLVHDQVGEDIDSYRARVAA